MPKLVKVRSVLKEEMEKEDGDEEKKPEQTDSTQGSGDAEPKQENAGGAEAPSSDSQSTESSGSSAEKGWEEKKRGAPSKEDKQRELKIQTKISDEVDTDLARIRH